MRGALAGRASAPNTFTDVDSHGDKNSGDEPPDAFSSSLGKMPGGRPRFAPSWPFSAIEGRGVHARSRGYTSSGFGATSRRRQMSATFSENQPKYLHRFWKIKRPGFISFSYFSSTSYQSAAWNSLHHSGVTPSFFSTGRWCIRKLCGGLLG